MSVDLRFLDGSYRTSKLLGSLSKDDGYGNENVIPKYNLALWQVFRSYSVLFTFYNTGELSCNWMGTNGFKVKTENDCFIVICSRCLQYLKYGDFTLFLCGVRQTNARKFVLHVQHEHFPFLTNNIIALWRCRSRSRRLCLNSLVYTQGLSYLMLYK